jgi:hypothetical protein
MAFIHRYQRVQTANHPLGRGQESPAQRGMPIQDSQPPLPNGANDNPAISDFPTLCVFLSPKSRHGKGLRWQASNGDNVEIFSKKSREPFVFRAVCVEYCSPCRHYFGVLAQGDDGAGVELGIRQLVFGLF